MEKILFMYRNVPGHCHCHGSLYVRNLILGAMLFFFIERHVLFMKNLHIESERFYWMLPFDSATSAIPLSDNLPEPDVYWHLMLCWLCHVRASGHIGIASASSVCPYISFPPSFASTAVCVSSILCVGLLHCSLEHSLFINSFLMGN